MMMMEVEDEDVDKDEDGGDDVGARTQVLNMNLADCIRVGLDGNTTPGRRAQVAAQALNLCAYGAVMDDQFTVGQHFIENHA